MATEQDVTHPYRSRYAKDLWVTAPQYLAEGMVARQAKKENIELPQHFWNTVRWKRVFLLQLRFANALLKIYDVNLIISTLKSPKGKYVYSLGAKNILDPLLKIEQERLRVKAELKPERGPEPTPLPVEQTSRPTFVEKPNLISKLRDL